MCKTISSTTTRRQCMFRKLIKMIQISQEKRVAHWQLQNMSDNQLKDIGVTRGEIESKIYRQCSR